MKAFARPSACSLRFRRMRRPPLSSEAVAAPDADAVTTQVAPQATDDDRPRPTVPVAELERRLAETTARMNQIMDNVPAGIVLMKPIAGDKPDFLITEVNRNVNTVAGFTTQYLFPGRSLAACLRPAATDGMYGDCDIDQRIAERMVWYASRPDETIWSVFPTVENRFVKATRSPLGDFGFVVVTVDTTEQVKTERALVAKSGQFDLMLENIPAGVFMCAPDFTLLACNRRVNELLGLPDGRIQVGLPLEACLRMTAETGLYIKDQSRIDEIVKERFTWYATDPDRVKSIVIPVSDGRFIKINRSPVGEYGMVVVFVDITEQVKIEQDLKAARDRAEAALEDLLATQDHLVQAEKMASLGRLVGGAAHEINTPLGVAITMASMLSEQIKDLAAALAAGRLRKRDMDHFISNAQEGCELQMTNLHRAADLVHSFKQVAVDQASDLHRAFCLKDLLSDIVVSLSPVWRKAGHKFEIHCSDPIEIDGYPGVIAQIVTNLVTNSVIHGFEPGRPGVLTIAASLADVETVELCYQDNGKGIPPAARDKVFDPFFTTRRSAGSTGLGLHIIYNLVVSKLGGRIELESGERQGVSFVIRFPRSRRQP